MRGIVPRKVKGFRDIEPQLNSLRWQIINAASKVYKSYGFEHWDTPVLEYSDNLGKFLPDKETVDEGVYSFRNPEREPVYNQDGSELLDENDETVMENHFLSLRYDLTAPLARKYAEDLFLQNLRGQLSAKKPPLFRRYQYGPVFRFEAKLTPGRFREFWQLDFDTVGSLDNYPDAEACLILADALEEIGLKRGSYIVKVSNRKLLKGFIKEIGLEKESDEQDILRVVDKFDKIGLEGLELELGKGREDSSGSLIVGLGLDTSIVNKILAFLEDFLGKKSRREIINMLEDKLGNNEFSKEGIHEMSLIHELLSNLGYDEQRVVFDPTLVRGLAYYTGTVYEVESLDTFTDSKGRKRKVGSISGGGRYDGLIERFLKIKVPATGASIGVDRLAELLMLTGKSEITDLGPVLITFFDESIMPTYQKIAKELRNAGINTEIYYGANKGLKKQLSYADSKNSPVAVLLGEDEFKKGVATVRNLYLGGKLSDSLSDKDEWREKVQAEVPLNSIVNEVIQIINSIK